MKHWKKFSRVNLIGLLGLVLFNGTLARSEEEVDRKIAPSDTILVEVFGEKELTRECRVQASGIISYPLLGSVEVAGKTTAEVVALLQEKLEKDYLVDPQVSVSVNKYRARTVTVLGFVEKSGSIELPDELKMDIVEAIGKAGGFSLTANRKKIELTRKGKTTLYKFDQLRKETDAGKKIWLEPGDVIYVHESPF